MFQSEGWSRYDMSSYHFLIFLQVTNKFIFCLENVVIIPTSHFFWTNNTHQILAWRKQQKLQTELNSSWCRSRLNLCFETSSYYKDVANLVPYRDFGKKSTATSYRNFCDDAMDLQNLFGSRQWSYVENRNERKSFKKALQTPVCMGQRQTRLYISY